MKFLRVLLPLTLCVALVPFASAQTAPASTQSAPGEEAPVAPALADTVVVPVFPAVAAPLPEETPLPVNFTLGAQTIEGIDPKLTEGVTLQGFARRVRVAQQGVEASIGQVVVTSVAKEERVEPLDTQGLTAQFEDAGDTLFPEDQLDVEGSRTALIAALQRLATVEEAEEEDQQAVVGEPGGDGADGGSTASNAPANDEASGYRSPDYEAPPPEEEPVLGVRLTTDGCTVRIDEAQGVAIQQSRTETTEDGTVTDSGACSDSEKRYPIKEKTADCPVVIDLESGKAQAQAVLTYTDQDGKEVQIRGCQASETTAVMALYPVTESCDVDIDLDTMTVTPKFQLAYTAMDGSTVKVTDCQPDNEAVAQIVEDTSSCPVSIDLEGQQAVIQAVLTYPGGKGTVVQARGCEPSQTVPPLPMVQDSSSCPLRHDFDAGETAELGMWTYVRDGPPYQATPCVDTGRKFDHTTVTEANGAYICPPIVNSSTVTILGRRQITVDGQEQYITECTPVSSAGQALQTTTDGCMNAATWDHDIAAGVSYGQSRTYFLNPDGSRQYVGECTTNSTTYAHDHTLVGYQNHDQQLFAYPLMKVSLRLPSGTTTILSSSEVLPGAAQFPYLDAGDTDTATGEFYYTGCDKFEMGCGTVR